MADCGCRIKNLPYTDADVAPASIVQCSLHANAEKLRDALEEIRDSPHCSYDSGCTDSHSSLSYATGVADGHRCAANTARAVLAETGDSK